MLIHDSETATDVSAAMECWERRIEQALMEARLAERKRCAAICRRFVLGYNREDASFELMPCDVPNGQHDGMLYADAIERDTPLPAPPAYRQGE
jgi:hypothetical protein